MVAFVCIVVGLALPADDGDRLTPAVPYGFDEAAPAVPLLGDSNAPLHDAPRGLLLAMGVDTDWSRMADGVGRAVVVSGIWAGREVGAAVTLIATRPLGMRLQGEWYPWARGALRPFVGVGTSLFLPDISVRTSTGLLWKMWDPWVMTADLAYERFIKRAPDFRPQLLVVGLGMGYNGWVY